MLPRPGWTRARTHGTTISQPTWPGVPDRLHPAHGAGALLGFILRERASSFASGFHGSLVNVATSITFVLPETRPKLSHWSACNWCFFKTPYANTSLASSSASVMQTNESPWSFPGPNERPKLCLFPSAPVSLVVDSIKVLSWSAAPGDNPRSMNTASVNPGIPLFFKQSRSSLNVSFSQRLTFVADASTGA